jgi:hypothetical protein
MMKGSPLEIIRIAMVRADVWEEPELVAELAELLELVEESRTIMKFAADAAVKHARESAAWREAGRPAGVDHTFDRQCVGRLHNAAKRSRAALAGGMCALCTLAEAEPAGDMRTGECPECDRILVGDYMKR